jgi:hypothetical protein
MLNFFFRNLSFKELRMIEWLKMKREAGGQGEISVGRIFGAATPPGALVHVI